MRENNIEIYRKVLTNTSPTVEIVGEGEEWNMTFKVGVSFVTFLKIDASEVNLKKFPWKHHSVNSSILPRCKGVLKVSQCKGVPEDKQDIFQDRRGVPREFPS